jgi:hypothetical protein
MKGDRQKSLNANAHLTKRTFIDRRRACDRRIRELYGDLVGQSRENDIRLRLVEEINLVKKK